MQQFAVWISLGVCLWVVPALEAEERRGSLNGVVRYLSVVPAAVKIPSGDGGTILHRDLIVDPKTKGLRDVFASLENAAVQPKLNGAKPVVVDQREMLFLPRVVAVQHGQAVSFDNSDTCNHSVMASSAVPANQLNRFVSPGKPMEHVFEPQKKPVLIGCSLHAWMRAWIYVMPHPWFALTDDRGKFQIKDIPPGKYTLWLHHADTGSQERREIEIPVGKAIDLTIDWKKVAER